MPLLIISTIGLIIATFVLFALSWSITVSVSFHILAICLSIMNSYLVGRCVAQIMHEWKRIVKDRHYTRFFWYQKMGLFESAIFTEPKMADDYWLLIKLW